CTANYNCTSNDTNVVCIFKISSTESHYLLNQGIDTKTKLNIISNNNMSCVQDYHDSRVLSCNGEYSNLTIDSCISICKKKSDSVCVGVEDGTQCFCGNASQCNKWNVILDRSECSSSCANHNLQICGGPWALNVVDITPPEPRFTTLSIIIIMVVGFVIICVGAVIYFYWKRRNRTETFSA
ncbi:11406_t:CDS:1, partial [Dentiscutata erythropus]